MASQIQLTRSGTSGVQPEPSELEYGELAINYADGKLFYKDSAISVKAINDTYLNSNNTIYVNSTNSAEPKIGLNTTSPEHLLDLGGDTGSTYNSLRINQGATGTAIRIGTAASGDVTLMRVDSTNGETDSQGYGFSIDYLGVGGGNNKKLAIMADNQDGTAVQALTILQDGKIGIGTDTPSHELEVDGTIRVTGNTNLIRFNDGTEDIGFINNNFKKLQINAGGSVDTLQLQTNGNNALVIDNAQKVGIGTTAPYSKLTVKGVEGLDTASFTLENSGGARVHQYYNGSASADDFYITRSGTGGSEITLQSAGDLILNGANGNNVGIGTTTPSVKLEVVGNAIAATPTADTHLTTKAYVDGRITAEEYRPGEIIECVSGSADGRSIVATSGTYTLENITAKQALNTATTYITGSRINYLPPVGAKCVEYCFKFKWEATSYSGISNYKLYIESDTPETVKVKNDVANSDTVVIEEIDTTFNLNHARKLRSKLTGTGIPAGTTINSTNNYTAGNTTATLVLSQAVSLSAGDTFEIAKDVEVKRAYKSLASDYNSHHHAQMSEEMIWNFDLTAASEDLDNGKLASWTTPREIKIAGREHNSTYHAAIHANTWRNNDIGHEGANTDDAGHNFNVHTPNLKVIAIA